MRKSGLTRRQALAGMGATGALTPFLPPLEADAAETAPPRRLLIFATPDGVVNIDQWSPQGGETDFVLSEQLKPLEPVKDQLVILRGVEVPRGIRATGGGHGSVPSLMLTNQVNIKLGTDDKHLAGGISVDQFIADKIGAGTRLRSLELAITRTIQKKWNHPSFIARSYRAARQPVMPDFDPYAALGRIFTPTNDPVARAAHEQRMLDAGSVLDLVRGDLASLKQRVVSQSDRLKIDAHEQALREIEKRLAPGGSTCEGPMVGNKVDVDSDKNMPAVGKVQMDIALRALSCDLTRVATVQWGQSLWEATFSFLGLGTEFFHEFGHRGRVPLLVKANAWLATQFLYMLRQLESTPEPLGGKGSMLDNTLMVWVNEFANGDAHSPNPMPVLFAGGRNFWRTGRFKSYASSIPIGDVLTTICHLMGTPVEKFGDPRFTNGALTELLS